MTRGVSPHSQLPPSSGPGRGATPSAERVRSVLTRALSARVEWLDGSSPGTSTVFGVVLDPPEDDRRRDRREVRVEVADVAPLPMADRIRARVRLHGYAAMEASRPGVIRLQLVAAELDQGGASTPVSPDELRAAEPDPIASGEGAFLSHLMRDHADLVRTLTRLVDPATLDGARRAVPLGIDRHGLTLRVEYRRGHRDVTLEYAEPADSFDQVRIGLRELAMRAHAACVERRAWDPPRTARRPIRDLLAAGPAAARLCAPEDPGDPDQRHP